MRSLQPYTDTRDSGVQWLGTVPSHWQVVNGGRVLAEKYVNNRGMIEDTVLSLSYGQIVIKPKERLHGLVPESFETYQVVEPGDIIVRPTDLQNDWNTIRVGIARDRGIITSAYLCFHARPPLTPAYAHLLLLGYDLKKIFYGMGSGLRQNLDWSDFKRLPMLLPPRDEQDAIVRYIRHLDQKTSRFIRNRRRLIEVSNEQKQAIINRAVTRGLDPNVRLKPSGIDWLGEIPATWEAGQLRRWFEVVDCKHLTVPFVEQGIPLASVREVQKFDLNLNGCKQTTEEWIRHLISGGRRPKRGDLIYCRNVSVGACAYVDNDESFAMGQDVCLIRSDVQNQRFLNYLLHSWFMKQQLSMLLVGSTFNRINVSEIKSLTVLLPPRAEQDLIVEHLDRILSGLGTPLAVAAREIELVREYRTRLIADVVTGKLDVRGFVPPEEIGPVDLEDADLDENGDEGLGEGDEITLVDGAGDPKE